jgi:hypothetical protein
MASFEFLAIVLSLLGLTASLIYYARVLDNQNKTRQTQLFLQFYNRLTDKQFYEDYKKLRDQEWTDYSDYITKYGLGPTLFDIYLEGVGLLVKRGQIDIHLVDDLMSSLIIDYWRSHSRIMLEQRRRQNIPQIAEWTEYLYNEIMKITEDEHPELKDVDLQYHSTT